MDCLERDRVSRRDETERGLAEVEFVLIESAEVDDRGETGVLCEPWKLNNVGGVRYSCPSSSSVNLTAPNPPCFRHRRATRSAHSSTFTNRTAPASSIARGSFSCNTRTDGKVVWGISGGACVAMIRRELARNLESKRGLSSSVLGAGLKRWVLRRKVSLQGVLTTHLRV